MPQKKRKQSEAELEDKNKKTQKRAKYKAKDKSDSENDSDTVEENESSDLDSDIEMEDVSSKKKRKKDSKKEKSSSSSSSSKDEKKSSSEATFALSSVTGKPHRSIVKSLVIERIKSAETPKEVYQNLDRLYTELSQKFNFEEAQFLSIFEYAVFGTLALGFNKNNGALYALVKNHKWRRN